MSKRQNHRNNGSHACIIVFLSAQNRFAFARMNKDVYTLYTIKSDICVHTAFTYQHEHTANEWHLSLNYNVVMHLRRLFY